MFGNLTQSQQMSGRTRAGAATVDARVVQECMPILRRQVVVWSQTAYGGAFLPMAEAIFSI